MKSIAVIPAHASIPSYMTPLMFCYGTYLTCICYGWLPILDHRLVSQVSFQALAQCFFEAGDAANATQS